MRGHDDDVITCVQLTTVNYSDDEMLRDSAPLFDDSICVDDGVPRRKSADYGCAERRACFTPFSRLDVEHHPVSGGTDRRLATTSDASSRVPRTTTLSADDSDEVSTATAWSRDSVRPSSDDEGARKCGASVDPARREFIREQLARYERPALNSLSSSAVATASISEFVVCRRDVDRSSTTSSSSLPAPRLVSRLAPQSSPPSRRPQPTSLRARKREQTSRSTAAAAAGRLRRSSSLAGSSAGGDEGFADGRARTPEPRRRDEVETSCLCRDVTAAQSSVSSTSDQARKRSYRVGLNLFNKSVSRSLVC